MKTNSAFFGDENLKNELLKNLKHHQEIDAFIQGQWLQDEKIEGNGFKGCFYGCTTQTNKNPREKFSEKYGIDLWYCYLTERIFEGLPKGEFESFPYDSINIIPLNFDFNRIKSDYFKAILLKQLDFVTDENVRNVLISTAELFNVPFNEVSKPAAWSAAESAESAARSAWLAARPAESAAMAAAESAAWSAGSAAWLAAESAARSAWSAAESAELAAESAAWSPWSNFYIWQKDTLFNLIKENKQA